MRNAMGKNGVPIQVPKIKTMVSGAHEKYIERLKLVSGEVGEVPFNCEDVISSRAWLRKTKLDELLQLPYNVLINRDMSLVGIRPRPFEEWVDLYSEFQMRRVQKYKPGLIGVSYALNKKRLDGARNRFNTKTAFERKYLMDKKKAPLMTDFRYGSVAVYNVFVFPIVDKLKSLVLSTNDTLKKEFLNFPIIND